MKLKELIHPIYNIVQMVYGKVNQLLSVISPLPPMVLRLRLTNNCNLSCHYCFLKEGLNKEESHHLSLEEWKKIIATIPKRTIIDFSGNEPLLARNYLEILKMFLERGHRVSLITNGFEYDDAFIELITKHKLYYLMVSIDGQLDTHNKIRGNQCSFTRARQLVDKVIASKEKFKSKFPLICIKTTLLPENITELESLQNDVLSDWRVDQHTLNLPFQNKGRGGTTLYRDLVELEKRAGNTQIFTDRDKPLFKKYLSLLTKRNEVNVKPPMTPQMWEQYLDHPASLGVKNCTKPFSILTLYFDGRIAPCDLAIELGNIREVNYDLKQIWKSPSFIDFWHKKKAFLHNLRSCEGCNLSTHCRL